jgi:hypothetical protein
MPKEIDMKMSPLRLLLTAVISTMLVAGSMAVPASAGSPYKQWPTGWSNGSNHPGAYQYGSAEQVRYDKKWKKSYKSSNAHKFRAPKKYSYKSYKPKKYSYKSYKPRKFRRHDDNFVIGLGLGFLGAAILSAPYYQASGDWCHVHRYPVRGMTFHTDVRCFKHRNWNSPSILYVQ